MISRADLVVLFDGHRYIVVRHATAPFEDREAAVLKADGTVLCQPMKLHKLLRFCMHASGVFKPIPLKLVPEAIRILIAGK